MTQPYDDDQSPFATADTAVDRIVYAPSDFHPELGYDPAVHIPVPVPTPALPEGPQAPTYTSHSGLWTPTENVNVRDYMATPKRANPALAVLIALVPLIIVVGSIVALVKLYHGSVTF